MRQSTTQLDPAKVRRYRQAAEGLLREVAQAERALELTGGYRFAVRLVDRGEGKQATMPPQRRWLAWLDDLTESQPAARMALSAEGNTRACALGDLWGLVERCEWRAGTDWPTGRRVAAMLAIERAMDEASA